jgi:uncharacterized repeat protein (TIGR01451 family)
MTTLTRIGLRAALIAAAGLSWWTSASAQLTPAGTSIQSRATVNYSVGGQPQTLIESSPSGNTSPGAGAGANTSFLVDNRIDLTVAELSGNATISSPGATGAVLAFTVTNTGNAPQGYQLTVTEEIGTLLFGNADNADVGLANLQVRVDEDPSSGNGTGNGTYDGTETETSIDILNPGSSITVFVVVPTVPLTLVNGNFANVNLSAQAAVAGTNGLTLEVESPGANDPTTVEVVFADDPLNADATESAADQLAIRSAALTVTKTQAVLDDGFGSASPRAIPGAFVEYTITVANSSTTTAASGVAITDPLPANTAFQTGLYAGSSDVAITGGAAATCVAETPADANADGCFRNGGNLVVGGAALGNIAANGSVSVRFQVRIN